MNNEMIEVFKPEILEQYPLFMPPDELSEKGQLNWSKKELKKYFEWYMSIYEERIAFFLSFFEITYSKESDIIFNSDYSEMMFKLFDKNPLLTTFKKQSVPENAKPDVKYVIESTPPRQAFTNLGYAIAADSGLLLAKVILDNRPDLIWATPTKGGKTYVNYNKVVIKQKDDTFGSSEWDPIGKGIQNIGYAINVSRIAYDYAKSVNEIVSKK